MYNTTTIGQAPGLVTPENDEGIVTGQGNNPLKTTNYASDFKSKIKAVYARLKAALSGFYLDRGIGLDSIAMLILVAVFAAVRAFQ